MCVVVVKVVVGVCRCEWCPGVEGNWICSSRLLYTLRAIENEDLKVGCIRGVEGNGSYYDQCGAGLWWAWWVGGLKVTAACHQLPADSTGEATSAREVSVKAASPDGRGRESRGRGGLRGSVELRMEAGEWRNGRPKIDLVDPVMTGWLVGGRAIIHPSMRLTRRRNDIRTLVSRTL